MPTPFFSTFSMRPLSHIYKILLYMAIVLLVYYPTQFAEISLVDDMDMLASLFSAENFSPWDVFFPRSNQGGYYRPLIGLSFWLDKYLWFLDEHLLHFESVVAHLVNGILVYFVCREAMSQLRSNQNSFLPLVASLLFALHPVATESVNWISGRTDIMMGTFVLISVFALLRYHIGRSRTMLFVAIICLIASVLAKEAAFGILPGILFFLSHRNYIAEKSCCSIKLQNISIWFVLYPLTAFIAALFLNSYWIVLLAVFCFYMHVLYESNTEVSISLTLRKLLYVVLVLFATLGFFVLVRKIVFTSSVGKIGQTVTLMFADMNYTISLFLGALGFYIKKFFLPLPLNFFILEIDPLYDFIGIIVLFAISYLFVYRTLPAIFTLLGVLLVLPALPFSFGTIAWTGYAERYIYLSSSFWIIAIVLWAGNWAGNSHRRQRFAVVISILLCVSIAAITFERNLTWKTNVALLKNTVEQSPKTRMLWDMYIRALIDSGREQDAEAVYNKVTLTLPAVYFDDRADLMMGAMLIKNGRYSEALDLYQGAIKRTKFTSEALLAACLRLLDSMQQYMVFSTEKRLQMVKLEKKYSVNLYSKTRNPALLVEAGQRSMRRGTFNSAFNSFEAALKLMPVQDRAYQLVVRQKNEARIRR